MNQQLVTAHQLMPTYRTCLYPGRFQPLHNGHATIITNLVGRYVRVIVAICLAHRSHTLTDPFTGGERYEMIKAFLKASGFSEHVDLVTVPGEAYPTTWVPLIRTVAPPFDIVYARNPWIRAACEYWRYEMDKAEIPRTVSGTRLREMIVAGGDWASMVPESVARVIVEIDGVARLKLVSLGENC